jgi:hypothetical protein
VSFGLIKPSQPATLKITEEEVDTVRVELILSIIGLATFLAHRATHAGPFERLIRSAIAEFERKFCEALLSRLSPEAQTKLNAVLRRRSGRS